MSKLTREQAADVIRYYYEGINDDRIKDLGARVILARAAIYATRPEESILPDKQPMLELDEMVVGLDHLLR